VSAITWAQTDYGSVRVVNTAFGKGVMTWTNFEAPAGKKLGSYGGLKFLTSAEYKASPWADHGVEWSWALTAVPDCASRDDELRVWVPFCNAPTAKNQTLSSGATGETSKLRFGRRRRSKGNSVCCKQLSSVRAADEEAAAKFQDKWDKAKEDGIPVHYNEQCTKCGARLSKAKLRVHHLHDCPGSLED
jgi:hypothetical protein